MATTRETVECTPEEAFDLVLDPEAYPHWVVGTRRIRAVDDTWPDPGSRFHHEVGIRPLTFKDQTTIEEHDRPHRIVNRVHIRSLGFVSRVTLTFQAVDGGTRVEMVEHPIEGPLRYVWNPVFDRAMDMRNRASLHRFARLVRKRYGKRARRG